MPSAEALGSTTEYAPPADADNVATMAAPYRLATRKACDAFNEGNLASNIKYYAVWPCCACLASQCARHAVLCRTVLRALLCFSLRCLTWHTGKRSSRWLSAPLLSTTCRFCRWARQEKKKKRTTRTNLALSPSGTAVPRRRGRPPIRTCFPSSSAAVSAAPPERRSRKRVSPCCSGRGKADQALDFRSQVRCFRLDPFQLAAGLGHDDERLAWS